jgi:hypothetical protein
LEVRIIGTPRSGTNLTKYLVERHLGVRAIFNRGFWKHAIFPSLIEDNTLTFGGMPVVVVSRDPISQIYAWYRLARERGTIFSSAPDPIAFVDSPLTMTLISFPPRTISFRFARPIDYWNQFHFAPLSLERSGAPIRFIRYEDLQNEPERVLGAIAGFLGLDAPKLAGPIRLPDAELEMTHDGDGLTGDRMLKPDVLFDRERSSLATAVAKFGQKHSLDILSAADPDVLAATNRADYREAVEAALGKRSIRVRGRSALRRLGI